MIIQRFARHLQQYFRLNKYSRHHEKGFFLRLSILLFILLSMVFVNTLSMMKFDHVNFSDALWLSLTTITTVGYGDFSATSIPARIVTVITIYLVGIALLAQIAAEFFEYRINIRDMKQKGLWRWTQMNEHVLIINTPRYNKEKYLTHLVSHIRKTPELGDIPIQILTTSFEDGLPPKLQSYQVVHFSGRSEDNDNLNAVEVSKAKYIILLAKDITDTISDSLNFDILNRIQEIGTNAMIIAEATRDDNHQRLLDSGATIVIRTVRAYPELLVRAMVAPGTETIMENLFKHDGDHMERYDIPFKNKQWGELICQLVTHNKGIPLAYINEKGQAVSNPDINACVSGEGIIVLINNHQRPDIQGIKACLS